MSSFSAFASFALYVVKVQQKPYTTICTVSPLFDVPNHDQLPCSNSINFPCQTCFSSKPQITRRRWKIQQSRI